MPKAAGTKNTDPSARALIYGMFQKGVPVSEIADYANITRQAVYSLINKYDQRGHHNDAPRSGRPQKMDSRSLRHLKISLEGDRRQSLSDLTTTINNAATHPVHPRTIRRAIRGPLGMNAHIAAKKPYLKPSHRQARYAWAKEHRGWGADDWEKVVWTDESSVEIGKGSKVVWVWRKPGERYLEKCLTPTFKSGRQSLMIWGCMAHGRLGPLIRIPKDQKNGADYVKLVLGGPLWDIYTELSEQRGQVAVMEDGAPVHRSKVAKDFRTSHQMEVFPHPAQSPDLNPIEHVWMRLKVRVNERSQVPQNVDELWEALQEEWAKIDMEIINNLVKSMPDRVEAVYKAKGGSTKY